jgi:4-hydroxybenzoate polyprenyltransferase
MANLPSEIKKPEALNLFAIVTYLIESARPIHWVKNLAIFGALIFAGDLYEKPLFMKAFWAFIAFNLATSATYIFNDILDAKADSLHPIKRTRPIASGKIPLPLALGVSLVLSYIAINLAAGLNSLFFFTVIGYLIMQVLYSLGLKNLAIIDILIIAAGFIIRVYAGAFVIDAHLSVWFLLCVISTALFLASGKRRAELGVISASVGDTRKSLVKYSKPLLDSYVTMFGNAAWLSWALFTFFESPRLNLPVWLFLAEISRTTTVNKLLMITIPVAIFGIMRYESLIFKDQAEAPEKVLLTDKALMISVGLWTSLVIWIIYSGISKIG